MIFDDMVRLKDEGMQAAAIVWETLAADQTLTPISIFKAACATKTSEMITRLSLTDTSNHDAMMTIIEQFFETAVDIGGQAGIDDRLAKTAADEMDKLIPITEEAYLNNEIFARRMHTLDGIALHAAKTFDKEAEMQGAIKAMQRSFMKLVLGNIANLFKDKDAN
jgi:hypothetical protein